MPLAQLLTSFQSLLLLPTSKLGPSGADIGAEGVVYILRPRGSLQQTLLWGPEVLSPLQFPPVFSEVLRLYFTTLEPWVAWSAWLPRCSSWFICMQMRDCPFYELWPCHTSYLPRLPISNLPTSLDECLFFNSLVVRLQYSLVFWQFWLFFVFKFVVVLLLVVWGGKVSWPMPPYWLVVYRFILLMCWRSEV